jgi:hypothetical protein
MESIETVERTGSIKREASGSWWQRNGPVVSLLLLAPVVSEVLSGTARVSVIFIVIPQIMTWGCGALLIRYWTRRWRKGWGSMLLMGLALGMAEEFVIQQTSISPMVGLAQHAYGRAFGVNWAYLLWALGFESVWVVMIPVHLVELLFRARRDETWLRTRGMTIASLVFILGSVMAWYGWTQRARVAVFHMAPYSPPPGYIAAGLAMILLLAYCAYLLPASRTSGNVRVSHSTPSPWIEGVLTCVLGTGWMASVVISWGSGVLPNLPFGWPLAVGLAWAALTLILPIRWTSGFGWSDAHRYALVFGGVMGGMLGGFFVFKIGGALTVDWIGKAVLNVAATIWLIAIGRRLKIGAHR